MASCPIELIDAAVGDRLSDQQCDTLRSHLSDCPSCRQRLDQAAASPQWWGEVQRLLDIAQLDDPNSDVADSSASDARLFEGDDPVGELKAAGVIDSPSHPEMLGKLGRYSIEREIGTGGMGVVLKGFDPELNRTVAIKVLAPHLARSGAARERFIREGRAAAAVVHENVVAIYEVDTSRRLPTLVMRYVDGVSLQRRVDTVGPLPICDALRIASQTAAGLAAAHRQGIVHRDVKPANILVSASGQRVWITDFGLARAVDDASLTRTGFIAGTPHYMSPEQARGSTVGPTSDLFSLGAVIYFMLAARPPWRADRSLAVLHRIVQEPHRPLWQVNPDVPREVSDLVDELLSKSAGDRQLTASDVQNRLEAILSDLQNPVGPHSVSAERTDDRPSPRWYSRPWLVIPLTVAATVLVMSSWPYLSELRQSRNGQVDSPRDPNATGIGQKKTRLGTASKSLRSGATDSFGQTGSSPANGFARQNPSFSTPPIFNPSNAEGSGNVGADSTHDSPFVEPSNPIASTGISLPQFNDRHEDQPADSKFAGSTSEPSDRWGIRSTGPSTGSSTGPSTGPSIVGGDNWQPNAPVASQSAGTFETGSPNPVSIGTLMEGSVDSNVGAPPSPEQNQRDVNLEPASTIPNGQMESLFELDRMLDEAESLLSIPPEITQTEWSRA